MRWLLDLLYLVAGLVSSPIWLVRMIRTGKIRTDWPGRFGRTARLPAKSRLRVLLHAVSVGEVNACRMLVEELAQSPSGIEPVIAATTDTGFARARELWADRFQVVRYPLDFSFAVSRFLRAVQPDVVALVELEVWPNFTAACARRGIPVVVVNGRLTQRSFKRYRLLGPFIRRTFHRLSCVAAQNHAYAERFINLGVSAANVHVAGTMKWDTALIANDVPGAEQLASDLGIDRTRPLIVAGSTAPDEHQLLHAAIPPGVQLLCAPRKPEWFDQAARDLPGCVRRSSGKQDRAGQDRFLLDTIGELRKAYALADVVVIGRSFGNLHGSDMMEPVALGKATIVGPAVTDFQDTVDALLASDAIVQVGAEELKPTVCELLGDPARRARLAENGRAVIRRHQGATRRQAELIRQCLATVSR